MSAHLEVIDAGDYTPSPEDAARAARLIAWNARSDDDEQLLLEACGLAPYRRGPYQTYQWGRKP